MRLAAAGVTIIIMKLSSNSSPASSLFAVCRGINRSEKLFHCQVVISTGSIKPIWQ